MIRLLVLVGALVVAFHWRLALTDQYTWLATGDAASRVLPEIQFAACETARGGWPVWNPYVDGGRPYMGGGAPGAVYPLRWLLWRVPLKGGWVRQAAVHWYWVLLHILAAASFLYCARSWGLPASAAIAGGLVFALGGYLTQVPRLEILEAAVWIPLIFMHFIRILRAGATWRSAVWGGVFTGLAVLAGDPAVLGLLTGTALLVWVCAAVRDGVKMLGSGVGYLAVVVATSALYLLPLGEYYYFYRSLPQSPLPPVAAGALTGLVGAGGAMLALFAVLGSRGRLETRLCLAAVLGGAALAAGVPVGLLVCQWGIAGLVALGMDRLLQPEASSWIGRIARGAGWLGGVFLLAAFGYHLWVGEDGKLEDRLVLAGLMMLGTAAVWHAFRGDSLPRPWAVACLVGILMIEMGQALEAVFPHRLETERNQVLTAMRRNAALAAAIEKYAWSHGVAIEAGLVAYDFGSWHGVPVEQRHGVPQRAGYLVARQPWGEWRTPVARGEGGWVVYERPGAPGMMQVVKRDAPCPAPETLSLIGVTQTRIIIHADLGCRGLVTASRNYYPGWQVEVDGAPARLADVAGRSLGVLVEAGSHRVEFRFRPRTLLAAAGVTALGMAALAGFGLISIRRRRDYS